MSGKAAQGSFPTSALKLTDGTAPSQKQISTTLRLCLRYAPDGANVFNRLLKILESSDIIALSSGLPEDELYRLVSMIAKRLLNIRLHMSDVVKFKYLCQARSVTSLPLIRSCDLAPPKSDRNDGNHSEQFLFLGALMPNLELLNMQAAIAIPFPDNLPHLRTLIVHQTIFDSMLRHICERCPVLQQLYLRNESHPDTPLNIACVTKLDKLKQLQLPLMLHTPVAIGQLQNLKHLILQRQQLWPDMDWLTIVKEIIYVKRYELQRLTFDGSWLARALDLSQLQLQQCFALKELLLSNCNLADPHDRISVPVSCERISLNDCTVHRLICYLRDSCLLQWLELNKCQLANEDGRFLMELLKQRQQMPILHPLKLRFSGSSSMRLEFIGWSQATPQLWEEWLQVREVYGNEIAWKQQRAAINMTFGPPLNFPADLEHLV